MRGGTLGETEMLQMGRAVPEAPEVSMRPLMLLLAGSTLTGCTLLAATPPSVQVTEVRLTGLGLTQQRLAVTLCVSNPNRTTLAFSRVTTNLDVAGAPLATGASDGPVQLPPLSSTAVPLAVTTTEQDLGPQLLAIVQSGGIDYRLHGSVSLTGSLGLTIPYSRSGRLDPVASGLNLALAAADPAPSRCAGSAPA